MPTEKQTEISRQAKRLLKPGEKPTLKTLSRLSGKNNLKSLSFIHIQTTLYHPFSSLFHLMKQGNNLR